VLVLSNLLATSNFTTIYGSNAVVPKLWAAGSSQGSRELLHFFHNFIFFIILFQFADADVLQSILDIWSHMLICSAFMCCVYDSFGTKLAYMLPSKLIRD